MTSRRRGRKLEDDEDDLPMTGLTATVINVVKKPETEETPTVQETVVRPADENALIAEKNVGQEEKSEFANNDENLPPENNSGEKEQGEQEDGTLAEDQHILPPVNEDELIIKKPKKKVLIDDDDDLPTRKPKKKITDDDDDTPIRKPKKKIADEDDEELLKKPKKKIVAASDGNDEDGSLKLVEEESQKKSKKKIADDEEEEPLKKPMKKKVVNDDANTVREDDLVDKTSGKLHNKSIANRNDDEVERSKSSSFRNLKKSTEDTDGSESPTVSKLHKKTTTAVDDEDDDDGTPTRRKTKKTSHVMEEDSSMTAISKKPSKPKILNDIADETNDGDAINKTRKKKKSNASALVDDDAVLADSPLTSKKKKDEADGEEVDRSVVQQQQEEGDGEIEVKKKKKKKKKKVISEEEVPTAAVVVEEVELTEEEIQRRKAEEKRLKDLQKLFDMDNLEPPKRPADPLVPKILPEIQEMFDRAENWIVVVSELWDGSNRFVELHFLTEEEQKQPEYLLHLPKKERRITAAETVAEAEAEAAKQQQPEKAKQQEKSIQPISLGAGGNLFDLDRKKKEKKKIFKKGEQSKKPNLAIGGWKKKFFVLREDKLMYFSSKDSYDSGDKPESSIFLLGAVVEDPTDDTSLQKYTEKHPYVYVVHARDTDHIIEAVNPLDRKEWIDAIKNVIAQRYA